MATYILRRMHYQKLHKFYVVLNSQQSSFLRRDILTPVCSSVRPYSKAPSSDNPPGSANAGEKKNVAKKTILVPKTSAYALSQNSDQIAKKTSTILQLDPDKPEGEKIPVLITATSPEGMKQAMLEIERVLQKHIEKTKENIPVLDRPEELLFIPKECAEQLSARNSSLLREIQNETASQIKVRHEVENEHGVLVTISASEEGGLKEAMEKIQDLISNQLSESDEMTVSLKDARVILGRKGNQKRDLENKTGTKISVTFDKVHDEALVTVLAKNQQELETAMEKIQKVIERSKYPKRTFDLTPDERSRLIGKDGNNIKRIRENLKQMDAYLFISDDVVLEAKDEENLDKALAIVNKELEEMRLITKRIKVSNNEAGLVIGKRGEHIKQIQQKLKEAGAEVNITVTRFSTPKCFIIESKTQEDADTAVAMINERLEKLRNMQKKTLEISQEEARYLIGPRGEHLDSIREHFAERGINITIPKKMTGENTSIQITGNSMEDIEEVVTMLEEKLKKRKSMLSKEKGSLSISWVERGRLIGTGGETIKRIQETLKQKGIHVDIKLPSRTTGDESVKVEVVGQSRESVQEAIAMLEEILRSTGKVSKTITLSWSERGKLIGPGGETLKRIEKELNQKGVGIRTPSKPNEDGYFHVEVVSQSKELVQEAVDMIKKELQIGFLEGAYSDTLLITHTERGRLVGSGGEKINQIRRSLDERGVIINVQESKSRKVVVQALNKDDLEDTVERIKHELQIERFDNRVEISRDATLGLVMGEKKELENKFGDKLKLRIHLDNHSVFNVEEENTALLSIECRDPEIIKEVLAEIDKLSNEKTWLPYKVNVQHKDGQRMTRATEQEISDVLDMTDCFYHKPDKDGGELILFVKHEEDYELALARIKEHTNFNITEGSAGRIDISRDVVLGLLMGKRREFENKFGDHVKLRLPLDHQASVECKDPQIAEEVLAEIQELDKSKWLPHTINVEEDVARRIIGLRSKTINDIMEKTNCYLSFDEVEDGRDLTIYARNEEDLKGAMARVNEFIEHRTEESSAASKKINISRDAYLGLVMGKRKELENKFEDKLELKLGIGDYDIFHKQEAMSAAAIIECDDPETIKEVEAEIEELNKTKWLPHTVKVDNEVARRIIGRKGETIKDILGKTNCFLHFKPTWDGEELAIYGRNEEDIQSALAKVDEYKKQISSKKGIKVPQNAILDLLMGKRKELEDKFGGQVKLIIKFGLFHSGKESVPVIVDCKDPEIVEEVTAEIEELGGTNWREHKMIVQQEVVKRVVGFRGQNIKEIMELTNCYLHFNPTRDGDELTIFARNEEDLESAIEKVNEYSKYNFTPERIGDLRVPREMPDFKDEDEELLYRIEEALDKREIQITQKLDIPEDFSFSKVKPLKIWSKEDLKKPEPQDPTDNLWYQLEREEHERLVNNRVPYNGFEEMIQLTKQGKMWHYPIDNEQGIEEEKDVSFADHVFLDDLLEDFPKSGPIRKFMEQVTVGLSQNPHLTVKEKHEHIEWYKNYFQEKAVLLKDNFGETGDLKTFLTQENKETKVE